MEHLLKTSRLRLRGLIVRTTLIAIIIVQTFAAYAANGAFGGGDGSTANPFIIQDAADLDSVRNHLASSYKLADDIDLAAYLAPGGAGYAQWGDAGWLPIGTYNGNPSFEFCGAFNGAGHIITGIWSKDPGTGYAGLFGYVDGAKIENVGIETALTGMKGFLYAGGLVASSINSTISNCFAIGIVNGAVYYVGGLAGSIVSSTITNCYADVKVTGGIDYYSLAGGLAGRSDNSTIANCYAIGNVTYGSSLVGFSMETVFSNCFFDSQTTGSVNGVGNNYDDVSSVIGKTTAEMKTKATFVGWDFTSVWGIIEGETYPFLQLQGNHSERNFFCGGTGTPADPYLICNAEQLDRMRNYLDKSFKLLNDIDVTQYLADNYPAEGWLPIGTVTSANTSIRSEFAGSFNGAGHKITGLWINRGSMDYVGLFGATYGATIDSVGIETGAAGIIGQNVVGGLAGYISGDNLTNNPVTNCYVTGKVAGTGSVGNVGGLVGSISLYSPVANCYAVVNVTGAGDCVGGLAGITQAGYYASQSSPIADCYAAGNVTGTTNYVGGLVGCSNSKITDCHATGNVSGADLVGGLVGICGRGSITANCYATGNVNGNTSVGGFAGGSGAAAIITNCFATGNATGTANIGGFVGSAASSILRCYAAGSATGADHVGGFVGMCSEGSGITNCYATGDAIGTGDGMVGGFVGFNYEENDLGGTFILVCYAVGKVIGNGNYVGGFAGRNYGGRGAEIAYCFFDTQATGQANGIGVNDGNAVYDIAAATTAEMKLQATYDFWDVAYWDFKNTWEIDEGNTYPLLIWQDAQRAKDSFCGGAGTRSAPYLICNAEQLDNVRYYLSSSFKLENDIDVAQYLADKYADTGWEPIAATSGIGYMFSGVFNGAGHSITGLWINNNNSHVSCGLFGNTSGARIDSVGIELGAAGINSISSFVGGLVGSNNATITNCYVTGQVSGTGNVGGLVGYNSGPLLANCYFTGQVTGTGDVVGGLVGSSGTSIVNCYSNGQVTGANFVGGLVGSIGGMRWTNDSIINCYASGQVNGTGNYVGGFAGSNNLSFIINCFFDTQTTGQANGIGINVINVDVFIIDVTGKTTAQMKTQTTFANWDFTNVWGICEGNTYPFLQWQGIDCNHLSIVEPQIASLRVYPNPTNGMLYINTENDVRLKLYNLQGSLLLETTGKQIDMSAYSQGIYILQVNGKTIKVVKKN